MSERTQPPAFVRPFGAGRPNRGLRLQPSSPWLGLSSALSARDIPEGLYRRMTRLLVRLRVIGALSAVAAVSLMPDSTSVDHTRLTTPGSAVLPARNSAGLLRDETSASSPV